jgi:predicted CopG family antitoxin
MPGWINVPVRIEVHDRLIKARGDKSFSDFIDELLDTKESNTQQPPNRSEARGN